MDELDQPDDGTESRPSVKELVARIQQQTGSNNSTGDNSESSDDDDDSSPIRTVLPQPSNANYENVPTGPPRSRIGVYSPEPNTRVYTSSACIPIQTIGFSAPPNYYEPNVNTRFAKLRVLDSAKNDPGTNKISRMLENPQDATDRDTNNDSGYSTKVYGSSKGNSPCLSGQTDNDCLGASSLV